MKSVFLEIKYCGFIFLSGIFLSCGSASVHSDKEVTAKPAVLSETTTTVATGIVANKNFEYEVRSNGKIRSLQEQLFISESGGKLLICRAETGRLFPAGAIIAQLDATSIRHKLERAQQNKFNSQKEYESQLLGYENLLKDRTNEQADTIRRKLKISTGLTGAEQEITEANYELTKTLVRAPFTGVLADVNVRQGEQLKQGQELFRIYDPYNLLLETKILEADVALLRIGIPAEVSPISAREVKYKASVYEINPYVDENGMVLVKLKIASARSPREGKMLFPGMNCTATIKLPFEKTLVVPKESVVMRSGKAVVFTLEDGKAKWNYVTTGRDNGKEVEIKEGLQPNQKVITTNNLQLAHDALVKESGKEEPN